MNHAYLPDGRLVEWVMGARGPLEIKIDGERIAEEFLPALMEKRKQDEAWRAERKNRGNARRSRMRTGNPN